MATSKTADLLSVLKADARAELLSGLAPLVAGLLRAADELSRALGGSSEAAPKKRGPKPGSKRLGRPPGSKAGAKAAVTATAASAAPKKRGRPKKVTTAAAAPAAKKSASGRNPRGALQKSLQSAMKSGRPMSLAQMRDEILRTPMFRGREPKTLYTQIVQAVKKIAGVKKDTSGMYRLG